MAATPQDVQKKLDLAVADLEKVAAHYHISANGPNWKNALNQIAEARAEVGQLTTKRLDAEFSHTP